MADFRGFILLLTCLLAITGANSTCVHSDNRDMIEYFCSGGDPYDLSAIPDSVEKIRIVRMNLPRITRDTFSRFGSNLWVLSCSNCDIVEIEAGAFAALSNLQQLSLDSNHLTDLKGSWFQGLNYLTFLDVNYNRINKIEDDVFRNLPSLVDFRISGNRLECINLNAMSSLTELKRIFISENPQMKCPNALSQFLEDRGITFEPDPEWLRIPNDLISVAIPSHDTRIRPTVYEATPSPHLGWYYTSTSERTADKRPARPPIVLDENTYRPQYEQTNYQSLPEQTTIPWSPYYISERPTTQVYLPVEEETTRPVISPTDWYRPQEPTRTESNWVESDSRRRPRPLEEFVNPSEGTRTPELAPRLTDQPQITNPNTNGPPLEEAYWDRRPPMVETTHVIRPYSQRPSPPIDSSQPEVVVSVDTEFPPSVQIIDRQNKMQNLTAVIPIQPITTDKPLPSCNSASNSRANAKFHLIMLFLLLKCIFGGEY